MSYGIGAGRSVASACCISTAGSAATCSRSDALRALAAQAAVVIENARLYREVVESERGAEELRIAAEIQQALLPPPAYQCRVRRAGGQEHALPCGRRRLLRLRGAANGGLTFAIGDVAGKGTSAALLTAVIQGLFTSEVEGRDEPAAIMARINRGTVSPRDRSALCDRVLRPTARRRTSEVLQRRTQPSVPARHRVACNDSRPAACVLGLFDTAAFQSGEVSVASGDMLVLFSDGVTEAMNGAGEELGDARLEACLLAVRALPVGEILGAIEREVLTFCGGAPTLDDVTVMVVRIR